MSLFCHFFTCRQPGGITVLRWWKWRFKVQQRRNKCLVRRKLNPKFGKETSVRKTAWCVCVCCVCVCVCACVCVCVCVCGTNHFRGDVVRVLNKDKAVEDHVFQQRLSKAVVQVYWAAQGNRTRGTRRELEPQQTVGRFRDKNFLSHLTGCKFCTNSANAKNLSVFRFCCKILERMEPDKEFLDETFFWSGLSCDWESVQTLYFTHFFHSLGCLTTGPYPLPKRVLHKVQSSNLSVLQGHPIAAYIFFLVFLSLLSFFLSLLQQRVLEGSSYAGCNKSS